MFKYIVLGSAFFIASCAALFSVTGISELFAGHMISVGTAAISMEIGKIVVVSLLYRYYKEMSSLLKIGLSSMLTLLVIITSFGIYAYLSSSYAGSAAGIKSNETLVSMYTSQKVDVEHDIDRLSTRATQLQAARTQQENRLDSLIAKNRSTITQMRIIRTQDTEIINIQKQIQLLSTHRDSLSTQIANVSNDMITDVKLGTFYYISQAMNIPLDTIVKWFILVIIVVFDPLGVSLFFGYNVIIKTEKERKGEIARRSPNYVTVTDTVPDTIPVYRDNVVSTSEVAHQKTQLLDNPTELNNSPYYMIPGYDWKSDTRWHTDPTAKMYFSRLGITPTT